MLTRHILPRSAKILGLMVAAVGAAHALGAFAKANVSPQLPNGPAKPGFDITRFATNGGIFKTLEIKYSGGERYPNLARRADTVDLLTKIAQPRAAP